jgi:ArsR family transcriptional regulator, virulence genes transcriptional regulator
MDEIERLAIYRLHAEFCKTLSDANRLLIITELAKGEAAVNELARRLGLPQSNISKHLGLMKEHALVEFRREGSTLYYRLSDRRIFNAIKLLIEAQGDLIEKRGELARSSHEKRIKEIN